MSLSSMIAEMRGCVPNYSAALARTHLRNAWSDIRNLKGWSFQVGNTGFATPGLMNAGTATVTLGSTTVTGDATASAAWATTSTPVSLLTQRQFRVGASTIYNIIAADFTVPTAAVLTLDRMWIDVISGVGLGYSIYQCYYPAPVKNLQAWEFVLDVKNVIHLDTDNRRGTWEKINEADPQRQIFSNPGNFIPHGVDTRPGSATLGYPLYELYPQPQAQYAYTAGYSWLGPDLTDIAGTEAVPSPMTEHCVKTLARVKAYEWAEANKSVDNPRGAGADFKFLLQEANASYTAQAKEIRSIDRDIYDAWVTTMTRFTNIGVVATFSPATGMVSSRNL